MFCVFCVFCGTLYLFALLVLQRQLHQRGSILPTEFTDFHRWLGCVIGGVGMAGCHILLICAHPCLSVGGFLRQTVLCVLRVLWEYSLLALLVQLRQLHPLCWLRGYGRMPYPPNLCASVSICGRHISIGRFCVFCGALSPFARLVQLGQLHPLPVSVRRPIGFRSPSDQIPSATRSDSVRHPIRLRSPSNQIPSAARCHK